MVPRMVLLAVAVATVSTAQAAWCQDGYGSLAKVVGLPSIDFSPAVERNTSAIVLDLPHRVSAELWRSAFHSSDAAAQAAGLRDLIADAEAGHAGYDAVQHGARQRPHKRPTELRLGEIFEWIRATPGQPHAIGRYQFIPSTLRSLVQRSGAGMHQRFSPEFQDHLADMLLMDAGFQALRAGRMSPGKFMYNLAGIWAGLPLPSGRSRYHGYYGNRATISWNTYQAEMSRILALR